MLSLHTKPYRFQSDVNFFSGAVCVHTKTNYFETPGTTNVKEALNASSNSDSLPGIEDFPLMKLSRDIFIH